MPPFWKSFVTPYKARFLFDSIGKKAIICYGLKKFQTKVKVWMQIFIQMLICCCCCLCRPNENTGVWRLGGEMVWYQKMSGVGNKRWGVTALYSLVINRCLSPCNTVCLGGRLWQVQHFATLPNTSTQSPPIMIFRSNLPPPPFLFVFLHLFILLLPFYLLILSPFSFLSLSLLILFFCFLSHFCFLSPFL